MVKKITILILLLILSVGEMNAQAKVKDTPKRRQWNSVVYRKWSKSYFRPKWYYWLFHNRYRRGEDRRYIKQNLPNIATSAVQKRYVEIEKDSVTKTHDFYLKQDLDAIPANKLKYNLLIKDEYNELMKKLQALKVQDLILKCKSEFGTKFNIEYYNEIQRIKERHDLILNSYRPSAEKIEELQDLLAYMHNFYRQAARLEERLEIALKNKKYIDNGIIRIND